MRCSPATGQRAQGRARHRRPRAGADHAAPEADVEGYRYEATPIKRLPREPQPPARHLPRHAGGGGLIDPIDRKELREWPVAPGDEGAKDGELVRFELSPAVARLAQARSRDARQPQDQRKISLIAIHAHGIPDEFPEAVLPRRSR